MKIINLAEEQMKSSNNNLNDHPFFKEYFRLFHSNKKFKEDTTKLMQAYQLQDVSKIVPFLESLAVKTLTQINQFLDKNIELDMITFFGDCSYDGHGILLAGKPYVFFDLNAIIPRFEFYNFRAFMTHEMLHPIHYDLNPDFYRENYRTIEEKYLKLLLAEGIATYLSFIISGEEIEDIYWFGYLKQDQVQDWIKNCEKMKDKIGSDLRQAIDTGKLDDSLYNRLFGIEDFKKLTSYRTGYYYGAQIVKNFLKTGSIQDILTLDYHEARELIYHYF